MGEPGPQTPRCPGCDQPPHLVTPGGSQAFCGTDDCRVLAWNPQQSLAELAADVSYVDLSGLD